jgi:Uma2 family endonuclease
VLKTHATIGPKDHGRRMSLADFEFVKVQPGYRYELSRGVIIVSEIPNVVHQAQWIAVQRQLLAYDLTHPGRIYGVVGGTECKILIPGLESERHPDFAIYKTPPPNPTSRVWRTWLPELVIEIVSPRSEHRDYEEKREEYLRVGIREYWVIDSNRQEMLVHRRWGKRWVERVVRPPEVYTTRLLPGLAFDLTPVFAAADAIS